MDISKELYNKINTLPWQALFEYSKQKGLKEEEIKNKDKSQIIYELKNRNVIDIKEIDKLIEDYIYGNRITFSIWRFDENITSADIEVIKGLEGKEINCEIGEFRKVTIQRVTEYDNRLELIYVYSKIYSYINEDGKADQVWEQHKGCSWIGTDKSYVAYIVKHEKMTRVFANALIEEIHKGLSAVKPPLSALSRIFSDSVMSKIVLQGIEGEKTAISRSQGFTDEQKEEVNRVKENRFNASGSYITPIYEEKIATVRYNIKKGNIGILKHLSSRELFEWTERAINIIFEEIDNLKGKDAKKIFEELGQKIKWPLLSMVEQEKMNWILTQVIANFDEEQSITFPNDKKDILDKNSLFIKILRPYCKQCDSYEVPLCSVCGKVLSDIRNKDFCECGTPIKGVCQEGHNLILDKYWYIPTRNCIDMINQNVKKVYPNADLNYSVCIMEDVFMISPNNRKTNGEILFNEIEEFKIDDFKIEDDLIEYAVNMNEKCNGTCSYEKIEKCINDKQQICLPKLFYGIVPGFTPQPHKGGEYGDVSGRIKAKGKEYEMKGIIKKNSSTIDKKQNAILLSTSSHGQEIIRQFAEQGMIDARCQLIMVVAPQRIDNSFKGTLKFLARLSNKKVTFVELNEVCQLLRKAKIK